MASRTVPDVLTAETIEADCLAFLAAGGRIQVIPFGVSGVKRLKLNAQERARMVAAPTGLGDAHRQRTRHPAKDCTQPGEACELRGTNVPLKPGFLSPLG